MAYTAMPSPTALSLIHISLASQEQTWSTYLPDQYEKVQNNVTGRVGNLLYYITSDHPQELEEAIKK